MLTGYGTYTASNFQAPGFHGIQDNIDLCFCKIQLKTLAGERYPLKQVDIIFSAGHYQLIALGAQQFTGLNIREMGQLILQCNHGDQILFVSV